MFDQLLVLSMGRTMYYGEAKRAVSHFSKLGFACPSSYNPSDFMLDLLSPDYRSAEAEKDTKDRCV
jgi:hypothetical protein